VRVRTFRSGQLSFSSRSHLSRLYWIDGTGHGIAAAMGKLGGYAGVFLFPYLLHRRGLPGAEAAAFVSILGVILTLTLTMLPETSGKSLEAI